VVELTYSGSNSIFDMGVTRLIILSVECDVPIDSETLSVTDFVNLKIEPAQSFGGSHRGKVCVHIFIGMSAHTCIDVWISTFVLCFSTKRLPSFSMKYAAKCNAQNLSVLSFSNFIGNGSMYCLICASKQSVLHFQLISKNQPMQINVSYEDGGV
jgi:hypothetical protein